MDRNEAFGIGFVVEDMMLGLPNHGWITNLAIRRPEFGNRLHARPFVLSTVVSLLLLHSLRNVVYGIQKASIT